MFYKNRVYYVDTLSRRTYFWDTAVPYGSENSHNVVQLSPNEDKNYLFTPIPSIDAIIEQIFTKKAYAQ